MAGCYVAFHKQLGDLVLLEPALSRLLAHHGEPVRLMTRNGHADLVRLMPGVEFVKGLALAPALSLYCFDPLNKSAFRSLLAPVLERHLVRPAQAELHWYHPIIFSRPRNLELTDSYIAEYFWANTPVPANGPFRPPVLSRPPDEWAPEGWKAGKFILVNPTSGWKKKMWTVEGWTAALNSLADRHRFVITSAKADWQVAHCRGIAAATGAAIQPTTLRQFLWLCANARAVLSVDGAASHLAAAFGVKCFTVFGPTIMEQWHRPAPGQRAFQAPLNEAGIRSLKKLESAPVVEALAALGL
jgi:ADP-heptose:LPS heptosyltransferase